MGRVIGAAALAVVRALEPYGIDGVALALEAGVPPTVLSDPSERFESEVMNRLVLLAAEAADDPGFGLALGDQHALIGQDVHYAMIASESLAMAWERMARYRHYIGDNLQMETRCAEAFEISFTVPEPHRGTWLPSEVMAGSLVSGARMLLGDPSAGPSFVALRRPAPRDPTRFKRFFGIDVQFDSVVNELHFPRALVERPLPLANHAIAGHADSLVHRYLDQLGRASWADRVRAQLARKMPDGLPKRGDVARRLGVSERALGRHLANEGTSFRELLDRVRIDLACGYLENGRASMTEIAFLLGFSETSAFSRAFKRWKGHAPAQYVGPSSWPNRSTS